MYSSRHTAKLKAIIIAFSACFTFWRHSKNIYISARNAAFEEISTKHSGKNTICAVVNAFFKYIFCQSYGVKQ